MNLVSPILVAPPFELIPSLTPPTPIGARPDRIELLGGYFFSLEVVGGYKRRIETLGGYSFETDIGN